ncbi:MAG: TlpA disulfide reductase family protein [Pseudomonadota bacterium]
MKCIAALFVLFAATLASAESAPSFEFTDAEGAVLQLPAEQEGIGLYLFWASWCPYCRSLMPHLQSIADEYGDAVTIYALNFRDEDDPQGYLDQRGFGFHSMDNADDIAKTWGAHGTPAVYLVDDTGEIRFNLYELLIESPPGYDELNHGQKAQRRAPLWAARIRQSIDELISEG